LALNPGTHLGVYDITAPIGEGGMGQVYRARDTKLDREVAIKIVPEAFAHDTDRLARFQREAKTLASLNHPNIAAIYGLEESGGMTALVMELVEGEDLSQRIACGAIPLDEALPIAKQIAEALEAAHEQGIIHRDLKPANIKVRSDGSVKVLDFGLAKAMEPAGSSSSLSMSPTITTPAMTQAGMILGTAAYMSPEQAKGRAADKRSDVWAFGCVLYEILTGTRAFQGDDVSDTLAAVLRGEPEWSALPAEVPPAIRALVERCLAKDRKQRMRDIGDVQLVLNGAFEFPSQPAAGAPQATSRRRPLFIRPLPFVATAIVAVATVGIAAWSFRSSTPPLIVTRFSFTLGQGQQFTNSGRQMVAISPDGTHVVYVANQALYLRSMSETEARPLVGVEVTPGGGANPVFSPDGRSIAFHSGVDQTLKRIAVNGGAAITICPVDGLYGMSWSAEGIVFGQGSSGIMRVPANGGKPERLVSVKGDELAHGPQMLPGGQAVLFTLATGTGADRWDKAHVVVQTLRSGERKTVIEGGSDARYVSTGHLVYALGGIVFAVPFDVRRLEVTGGPVPMVEGVGRATVPTGTAQFSVSNSGSLIYIPGPASTSATQSSLALVDRKGGAASLKLPPGAYDHPRVSPDGVHIAYATDDGKDAIVWTYALSGASAPRRLTFGGRNRFPIWADSERVAFQSDREGDLAIFWQRADGTDQAARLTKPDPGTSQAPESWSLDGKTMLFRVDKGSTVWLWTLSIPDRKAEPFGDVRSTGPTNAIFSADHRWIAYTAYEPPFTGGIFVQPFPPTGAKYQISYGAGLYPLWSRDGKELLYSRAEGDFGAVSVTTQPTFAVGNPASVSRGGAITLGSPSTRRFDITPDGRILGIVPAGQTPSGAAAAPEIQVVLNWVEELKQRVPTR
jgi:serine/threonine protein kinase